MVFKILIGRTELNSDSDIFILRSSVTKGSKVKLTAPASRTQVRLKSFPNRVPLDFKKLLSRNILTMSLSAFKKLVAAGLL